MKKIIEQLHGELMKYRPLPFWSWNDRLEVAELKRQIHWMHENGIGGFFMHARGGLRTEYLSHEWMQCIEACCMEAEKLGMQAWAYDENGWPSGFAGGKLLKNKENLEKYILHEIGTFDEKADISYRLDQEQLVRVYERPEDAECLNLYIQQSPSSVDILNPDVVEQFLQVTHEAYKEYFGSEFSNMLCGFFTDEPQYYRWQTPYTPMVRHYFKEQYRQEVFDGLGLLFVEKEGYRSFRYRYWLALQTLMLENFANKVYTWCEENGVQFTGHYIEESMLGYQMMCCGGVMPFYEYQHIPGIDCLWKDAGNPLPSKQVGSVAAQLGKKQVLTESFGCCGWDVTPAELRRVAGYQFTNGVNLVCQHLLPYSEKGERKRDYPAHFHEINPWVKQNYREFNDYLARVGYLLAESEEVVNVAFLHPMRSAYLEYKQGAANQDNIGALEADLQQACKRLDEKQIAYHFLDETLLEKHGYVRDGKIGCGKCGYEYLVLPTMYTMGRRTEKLLREYMKQGGQVFLLGQAPSYLEGEPYDYDYLKSNCALEQIADSQPYHVKEQTAEVSSTYRKIGEVPFVFVQNLSPEQTHTQTFDFHEEYRSFLILDPVTMKTRRTGLEIVIQENESILLFPQQDAISEENPLMEYRFRFREAEVQYGDNYLTVDAVRYSEDGVHYSEMILCTELFRTLLERRYCGTLYLRYEFEIQDIPKQMKLYAENRNVRTAKMNGHNCDVGQDDISSFLQIGINAYEVEMEWFEKEETYYVLFGDGVTENLKNSIVYESEIEAICLAGRFGVYSHDSFEDMEKGVVCGQRFYIGEAPTVLSEPTVEGLPFFRGSLSMKQTVYLEQTNILLQIEGRYQSAVVFVNGHKAGELLFERKIDISDYAKVGENEIEIRFIIGNRNLLGPFHMQSVEGFIGPFSFKDTKLPRCQDGTIRYKLFLFYSQEVR